MFVLRRRKRCSPSLTPYFFFFSFHRVLCSSVLTESCRRGYYKDVVTVPVRRQEIGRSSERLTCPGDGVLGIHKKIVVGLVRERQVRKREEDRGVFVSEVTKEDGPKVSVEERPGTEDVNLGNDWGTSGWVRPHTEDLSFERVQRVT